MLILLVAMIGILSCEQNNTKKITLTKTELLNKIKGAWLARPLEFAMPCPRSSDTGKK